MADSIVDDYALAYEKCKNFTKPGAIFDISKPVGQRRIDPVAFQCAFLVSPNPFLGMVSPLDYEYNVDCAIPYPPDAISILKTALVGPDGSKLNFEPTAVQGFLTSLLDAAQEYSEGDASDADKESAFKQSELFGKFFDLILTGRFPRQKGVDAGARASLEGLASISAGIFGAVASGISSIFPGFSGVGKAADKIALEFLDLIFLAGDTVAETKAGFEFLASRLSGNQRYANISKIMKDNSGYQPSTFTVREWCRAGNLRQDPDFAPDGTTYNYRRDLAKWEALRALQGKADKLISPRFNADVSYNIFFVDEILDGGDLIDFRVSNSPDWNNLGPIFNANPVLRFFAANVILAGIIGPYKRAEAGEIISLLDGADKNEPLFFYEIANPGFNWARCGLKISAPEAFTGRDDDLPVGCGSTRSYGAFWQDTAGGNFDYENNSYYTADQRNRIKNVARDAMLLDGLFVRKKSLNYWTNCVNVPFVGRKCADQQFVDVFYGIDQKVFADDIKAVLAMWDEFARESLGSFGGSKYARQSFIRDNLIGAKDESGSYRNTVNLDRMWEATKLLYAVANYSHANGNIGFDEAVKRLRGQPQGNAWVQLSGDQLDFAVFLGNSWAHSLLYILTGEKKLPPAPNRDAPIYKSVTGNCPDGSATSCLPCDVIKERRPIGAKELTVPMAITWTGTGGARNSPEYKAWVKQFRDAGYPDYYIDCATLDVKFTPGPGATEPTRKKPDAQTIDSFIKRVIAGKSVGVEVDSKFRQLANRRGLSGMPETRSTGNATLDESILKGITRPMMVELNGPTLPKRR